MPDIMEAQSMRICSLPTMVTKVTDELLVAIFTICRMISVGQLYLFAKVAANEQAWRCGGIRCSVRLNLLLKVQ